MNTVQEILKSSGDNTCVDFALSLIKEYNLPIPQDFSSFEDLTSLVWIATTFFVADNIETALEITKLISDIEFANDFDIWTWVENALVLQSAIYRKQGKDELARACTNKIALRVENDHAVNKKVFKRNLNGGLIGGAYAKIESATDEISECGYRFALLWKLMTIREMGGGEDFTIDKADKEIAENIDRLKILIKTIKL